MASRARSDLGYRTPMLVLALASSLTACRGRPAPAGGEILAAAPDPESAHNGPAPASGDDKLGSLEQTLAQKAKKYAQGLVAEGPVIRGMLHEGARADQLVVLRGGFCYRILGAGGDGVEDMDLFLYDPDGVQTQQDPGQDRFPVLGLQAELCPAASGAFRLQALMYKGGGAYAVRVYRTP